MGLHSDTYCALRKPSQLLNQLAGCGIILPSCLSRRKQCQREPARNMYQTHGEVGYSQAQIELNARLQLNDRIERSKPPRGTSGFVCTAMVLSLGHTVKAQLSVGAKSMMLVCRIGIRLALVFSTSRLAQRSVSAVGRSSVF